MTDAPEVSLTRDKDRSGRPPDHNCARSEARSVLKDFVLQNDNTRGVVY